MIMFDGIGVTVISVVALSRSWIVYSKGICTGIFLGTYGFVDERDAREEIVEPKGFALSVLILFVFVLVVGAFEGSEESMIIWVVDGSSM